MEGGWGWVIASDNILVNCVVERRERRLGEEGIRYVSIRKNGWESVGY